MFCEKCGAQMSDQQVTCEACGWSVQDQAPAVQEAQPIPQYIPVEAAPAKKKVWPKIVFPIIAVVVAAIVALAILQPFGSDKDVVGKWQGNLDYTQMYTELFSTQYEGITFTDLKTTMTLEFKDDHTMIAQMDEDSAEKMMDSICDQLATYLEGKTGYSLEEILAMEGMTEEEWRQQSKEDLKNSIKTQNEKFASQKFSWSTEGEKIYLGGDKSSHMKIDGDTMELVTDDDYAKDVASEGSAELGVNISEDATTALFEGVVFKRVN